MKQSSNNLGFIKIDGNEALIPALLQYAEQVAKLVGFSTRECNQLQLALEETTVGVIKDSFSDDEVGEIDLTFVKKANGIEIHIHDMGLPYDPNATPIYDPTNIDEGSMDALGTFLIGQMVDEYRYNNLGIRGKEVVLIKLLESRSIVQDMPRVEEAEVVAPPVKKDIEPIAFNIRRMKEEEALEVCRCIYDCYGYSYANENVYHPERVNAMNQDGQLMSVVAVNDDNEIGGHGATIFYDHLPAEFGIVVTKKKFRGQGFARELGEKIVSEALNAGLKGLQVKEVTAHPYTQKFCAKLGYDDCGLLLAHSPKSLSFKGIADSLKQRNSDVLGFKYLTPPEPIDLYLPEHHQEMMTRLFGNIGVEVNALSCDCSEEPTDDKTEMFINVHSLRSLAEMGVVAHGKDAMQVIRQEFRKILLEEIEVIEFYLSLDTPYTAKIVPELEKLGFLFTGILPETKYGNAMIMQYFNGAHVDYDKIVLVSDVAQDLLNYIRKNDMKAD